jgi:putative exosortase-associated protein (TIGR04073 family)
MKRMIVAVAGLVAVCALTLATPATAAEEQDNHISKLVRGWTNVATFWLEVPKQMYVVSMQRDAATGILFGPFKGVGFGVARLGAGLYKACCSSCRSMKPSWIRQSCGRLKNAAHWPASKNGALTANGALSNLGIVGNKGATRRSA